MMTELCCGRSRGHGEVLRGHRCGARERGDAGAGVEDERSTDGLLLAAGVAQGALGPAVSHTIHQ